MPVEIERKFLVTCDDWRTGATGRRFRQGYLSLAENATVRVRRAGEDAFLTIKGQTEGISRAEFEYPIPPAHADAMLAELCLKPIIQKVRYDVDFAGKRWTVDVFEAENAGLVVAEVELAHPDEPVTLPPWVGEEVTFDPRYRNSALVNAPMGEGADI